MNPLMALIGPVTSYFKSRQEIKSAHHLKELEGIQNSNAAEYKADKSRTDNLSNSWKDEYITIIISIPAILCFMGPNAAAIVSNGFLALSNAPDYYQWLLVGVFSVGAGIPLAGKASKTIKAISGLTPNK